MSNQEDELAIQITAVRLATTISSQVSKFGAWLIAAHAAMVGFLVNTYDQKFLSDEAFTSVLALFTISTIAQLYQRHQKLLLTSAIAGWKQGFSKKSHLSNAAVQDFVGDAMYPLNRWHLKRFVAKNIEKNGLGKGFLRNAQRQGYAAGLQMFSAIASLLILTGSMIARLL